MAKEQEIQVQVPPDIAVGVYANFALVRHTEHEFTIDFCRRVLEEQQEDGPQVVRVVSRVTIAPSFVGPLLQAISQNAFQRDEVLRRAQQQGGEEE